MANKNPAIKRFVIKRGKHVFRLTDQEVEDVVKTTAHVNLKKTCSLMTRAFLNDLNLINTGDPKQIERFLSKAMPDNECHRMARLYENRNDDLIAPYDLWMAILSEQMLRRDSLMCRFIHRTIFDHADLVTRGAIMGNTRYNPDKKCNFDAVLSTMSSRNLVEIWKTYKFIGKI